jgi:hypothetical protein
VLVFTSAAVAVASADSPKSKLRSHVWLRQLLCCKDVRCFLNNRRWLADRCSEGLTSSYADITAPEVYGHWGRGREGRGGAGAWDCAAKPGDMLEVTDELCHRGWLAE